MIQCGVISRVGGAVGAVCGGVHASNLYPLGVSDKKSGLTWWVPPVVVPDDERTPTMWGNETNQAWLWLYGLLALVAVVALVVVAVRFFRDDSSSPVGPRRSAARRALDDRYTRGELTAEQYREQLADLGEQP